MWAHAWGIPDGVFISLNSANKVARGEIGEIYIDAISIWYHIEPQNLSGWKKNVRWSSPTINLTLLSPPLNKMAFCTMKFSLIFTERNPWTLSASPGPCTFLRADKPCPPHCPPKLPVPGPAAGCGGKGLVPVRHRSFTRYGCADIPSRSQLQGNAPSSTRERNPRKHQKTVVLKINRCI